MEREANPQQIREILKSIFKLTPKQIDCFIQLRDQNKAGGACITLLKHNLDIERSVVQKQLKILLNKSLAIRKKVTLSEFQKNCTERLVKEELGNADKGYLYVYSTITDKELAVLAKAKLCHWEQIIDDIEKS